ncbi:MAG: hypothetical protein Q9213_004522 [Squamulea squamosa]
MEPTITSSRARMGDTELLVLAFEDLVSKHQSSRQFTISLVIYNISRKFSTHGIVGHHTTPGLCRRGWEWTPSVAWQFLWNYLFGPYLLWNIRMINDIYHWRLQTIIAIVAGSLPGTPLWFAAVNTDKFAQINKYWLPSMWLAPGMLAMEIVTVAFPIYQILKHKRAAHDIRLALAKFDQKRLESCRDSFTLSGSMATESITSKIKGKMYPIKSLDDCLAGNHEDLQIYASCHELNGENIIFLTRVLSFRRACQTAFNTICSCGVEFRRARMAMFKTALVIFVTLIHSSTAAYPINIESPIYTHLLSIFGPATALIASCKSSRRSSSLLDPTNSSATPWDDPIGHQDLISPVELSSSSNANFVSIPLRPLPKSSHHPRSLLKPFITTKYQNHGNASTDRIVRITEQRALDRDAESLNANTIEHDPLEDVEIPAGFDEGVFDAAYESVKFMVWSETWQRYCVWRGKEVVGRAV